MIQRDNTFMAHVDGGLQVPVIFDNKGRNHKACSPLRFLSDGVYERFSNVFSGA